MEFTAKGKLLLTGEYSVLRGAVALSLPTTFGQTLTIKKSDSVLLHWKSVDENGQIWFEAHFSEYEIIETSNSDKAQTLFTILRQATTALEFNRHWGLGSSSTLVALIAEWAKVDAMKLFFDSMSGSGYDVATAFTGLPILYQLVDGDAFMKSVSFSPEFKDQIFFVYLGEKKNSATEVKKFSNRHISPQQLDAISAISKDVLEVKTRDAFEDLMLEHEALTSIILDQPTIFETHFPDYPNIVKSLGAWGGDFILATGSEEQRQYFVEKGFQTILSWEDMIGM